MPDQTTSYVIQVTDRVDPAIAKKLATIVDVANLAGTSIANVQKAINGVNAANLNAQSQGIQSVNTSTRALNTTTQTYTRAANAAVAASNAFANALPKVAAAADSTTQKVQAMIAAMQGVAGQARAVAQAAGGTATSVNNIGSAAGHTVPTIGAASAAIRTLEGNFTNNIRAAERFLVSVLNLGPALRLAFPIVGAIALIGVFAQMFEHIVKLKQAYKDLSDESVAASNAAILAGKNELKIDADLLSMANLIRLTHGQTLDTSRLKIDEASDTLRQLSAQREILASQNRLNEAGKTGDDLAKQRIVSAQAELKLAKDQLATAQNLAESFTDQLAAKEKITHLRSADEVDAGLSLSYDTQEIAITDPKQRAALSSEAKSAAAEVLQLNTQITVLKNNLEASGKKEGLASIKDEAKAARLEMQTLETKYKEFVGSLTTKVSPTQTLQFWESAEASLKHYSDNIDKVNAKEAAPKQQIASRNDSLDRTTESLNNQIASIGAYSNALKVKQELDKLTLEFQKTGLPLTQAETASLRAKIAATIDAAQYQSALNAQYNAAQGPIRAYQATQAALIDLLEDGAISQNKYQQLLNEASRTYQDATKPLAEYTRGLQNQIELFGEYGVALTVAGEIQRVNNQLRVQGTQLTNTETNALRQYLTVLEQRKQIESDIGAIYNQNAGALDKLQSSQIANLSALRQGIIGQQQYRTATIANANAQAQLSQDEGKSITMTQRAGLVFGNLMKGYKGLTAGATQAFGQFFTTLGDGFADSIAHALVFGGSIKQALLDTARQAVEGLISSFIKLGIQWVLNATIGAALAAAATAGSVAQAAIIASAWATPAALVSLATFGTNAAPADAALLSTTILAQGLALSGHKDGGLITGPGTSVSDNIPILVSPGEFVVKASAYAQHSAAVKAINSGAATVFSSTQPNGPSSVGSSSPHVEVHNYAGVHIATEVMSDDRVRMIINKETPGLIAKHTPKTMAAQMRNPNSPFGKAVVRTTTAKWVR